MILGLHHVAISTPDLEAAIAFYRGLLYEIRDARIAQLGSAAGD